jgi:hypothetical protein
MCKLYKLGFVFTRVDSRSKGFTQLALTARKTKCLSRINQAFSAAKEVINRWGSDVARFREISYAHGTFTALIDCRGGRPQQSLAGGICLRHDDKRNPNYGCEVKTFNRCKESLPITILE